MSSKTHDADADSRSSFLLLILLRVIYIQLLFSMNFTILTVLMLLCEDNVICWYTEMLIYLIL